MQQTKLGAVEGRFADLVWENAPVSTAILIRLAQEQLEWKRTTTYTVLKRLCDRGLFELKDGLVTVKVSREEFYAIQSEQIVQESFGGSLPAFVAAFTRRNKLSQREIEQLQQLIDESRR